jgi:hypothetical protein
MPARKPKNIKTWFYGKPLLAALCETLVNAGRFSPSAGRNGRGKKLLSHDRMSLWRELRLTMTLITIMLLESLNNTDLEKHLHSLSKACMDSKRKRLPQLCFFNSA